MIIFLHSPDALLGASVLKYSVTTETLKLLLFVFNQNSDRTTQAMYSDQTTALNWLLLTFSVSTDSLLGGGADLGGMIGGSMAINSLIYGDGSEVLEIYIFD